jgi:hypothetical protein
MRRKNGKPGRRQARSQSLDRVGDTRIVATMTQGAGETMRPTRTRGIVVVFAVTLAVLQYIDRVAISQAAPL